MSQLNDAPERDNNEIGNDSASEVGGSIRNLNNTINNYNEGQKAQGGSGDSGEKSDNSGDSNNSEKPNGSDNKDMPNESGNSDENNAGNSSQGPSDNSSNNIGQNPDAPQQNNNQNGANGQPTNSQPSATPQGNDSNVGDTPKVSSGPKPGDVAGESGGGVSTNAGTIKPPSSAESGSQAVSQGAQAAQQGAEAAKQAGEVAQAAAEGAAEGSVVPGYGTVAVAAARTAWALRHTIAKLVMVIILVIAILSSAIESLPGIIWNQAFDKDGNEIETSVEDVYTDLVATVQDFVNEAYTESVIKAIKEYNKGKVVEIDGESVNLNELNTPLLGDGIGDETVGEDGNKQYKYNIGTDICEIVAHFTVKCKLENKEPTKENLLKYLKKGKDDLFDVTIEDKFEKDGVKKKLKKMVYVEYKQAPQYRLDALDEVTMVMSALRGAWWEEDNQDFIYYLVDNPRISEEGFLTLCDNYNAVTGSFIKYSSPDGSVSFPIAGDITKVYYSNFTAIGGEETRTSITGVSKNAYYEYHKTGIVSSEDYENENTGDVGNNKFRYMISKSSGLDYTEHDKYVIPAYGHSDLYFMKRDQGMPTKSISDYGIDYEKITVSSLNRSALTECFEIDKNEPYPLVADYTGEDVTKNDGTTEKKWSVSQNYTPETFTCGMAISSYVEILRSCLYGANGENITIAPAEPVKRYEIIVTSESGAKVSGAKVVVKYKGKKVATVKTDSDGLAVYEGNKNKNYTFEVADEYQTTVTSKVTYGNFVKHNESNFICPLQTSGENQWVKITSVFGFRDDMGIGASTNHGGLDIVVLLKDTNESITQGYPVRAVADGEVIYSGEGSGYGYYVHIQHEGGTQTLYAHNSVLCVKKGDEVKQGQIIAYAGNTGVSTGPHLHFEVREYKNGEYVRTDPLNSIPIIINN